MPMKPRKGESQDAFMSRCVPEMMSDGKREQDQAVAACLNIFREGDKSAPERRMVKTSPQAFAQALQRHDELRQTKSCDPPDDNESREDFMDRCMDELGDEDACELMWDERSAKGLVYKTHAEVISDAEGKEFILSDETPDRMDDIILSDGWDLENFKKNPIALFNHQSGFPIGSWKNIRIDPERKQLRARFVRAPKGTSERIDEINALIEAGILKASSVGFRPIKRQPRDERDEHGFSGSIYTKSELVETSVVSVPANPNALAIAKSLNISPATIDLVFAGQGNRNTKTIRRGSTGGHAETSRNGKGRTMSGLAQRITDLEAAITAKREALEKHLEKQDDSNVSDADLEATNKFNDEIEQLEKTRDALINSEKLLAKSAANGDNNNRGGRALSTTVIVGEQRERVAAPAVIINRKKDLDLLDYVVRGATVTYIAKATGKSVEETRLRIYGDDEGTKAICEIVTRAASAPAMTTVTGWAAELAQTSYADLMPLLMPKAILTRLAPKGLTLSFGTSGRIVIPTRSRTPSLAGSFVGEGMAIPVRQGAFTSQTLTPKKMAVISTWTREMGDHSVPAIEGLIRQAIQDDTSVAIDTVLLDANAATVIRPPGLLNGVAATTPTAGGGIAALVGDIAALVNAISTATYGNVRNLVWLANPTDMLRASLLNTAGLFPFRAEIAAGSLNNIPIIDSATVTAKTLILVDAADFAVVGGEAPRMEMSDQATLHMEDTNPAELVASPSTVAAPQRSLFQTDSLALRMVMPLNWTQRRAGTVAWTQNVTW